MEISVARLTFECDSIVTINFFQVLVILENFLRVLFTFFVVTIYCVKFEIFCKIGGEDRNYCYFNYLQCIVDVAFFLFLEENSGRKNCLCILVFHDALSLRFICLGKRNSLERIRVTSTA